MSQAVKLIDALNGTFGRHNGYRVSHAKGFTAQGRFCPAAEEPRVQIPMLNNECKVTARFSVGGGKPGISDKSPTVRGIGLEIGNGSDSWVLTLISNPVFFANSAAQFRAFLAARIPDPDTGAPDPKLVEAFNEANPNTVPHQQYLKSVVPCRCYSSEQYHSGHAYRFDWSGREISARILLEPEGGRLALSKEEMETLSDDFLHDRFLEKLCDGPARWSLKLVIANAADNVSDPTVLWSGTHTMVDLGTIQVELPDDRSESTKKVFDPTRMPEGVRAPLDDVFSLRSGAYAESAARRSV
ncbi:catalase [Ruegeria arenilitoris]|uniref:catalase n=1 Tax=Ruegeria arenilitoris TaxID=1173585 RepID=UPI001CFC5D8C|nr:catalase [Ruegeria arenilitoris]